MALLHIAGATRRIRPRPACLNPYTLHPVEIAGRFAALDTVPLAALILGLARGAWLDSLWALLTVRPLQRRAEAIAVVRHLLHGERAPFTGQVFRLAAHHALQYPVPRADVPLLIGAWGAKSATLAGATATEVKVCGRLIPLWSASYARQSPGAKPPLAGQPFRWHRAGVRPPLWTKMARGRANWPARKSRYLPVVATLDRTVAVERPLLARVDEQVRAGDFRAAGALIGDELLDRFAFAGTPEQIIRQTEAILAAGAARVEFGTPHGLNNREGLRLLGTRVLPAFR